MAEWLSITTQNNTISASPTQNTDQDAEDRLKVIEVTNWDNQKKLVAFKQLAGNPRYRIYIGHPANYYNGDVNNITCTIKHGNTTVATMTPSTADGFNMDYDSGCIYQDDTSEDITIETKYTQPASSLSGKRDYFTPTCWRKWPRVTINGTNYIYFSHVYDIHQQFLADSITVNPYNNFPEVFNADAGSYTYYLDYTYSGHNSNYTAVTCSPDSFIFVGRSYAGGGDGIQGAPMVEIPLEFQTWITSASIGARSTFTNETNKNAYPLTIRLAANDTGSNRSGYIQLKDTADTDNTVLAVFNILQAADNSKVHSIDIQHTPVENSVNNQQFDIQASPYFVEGQGDINIFIRGQRPFNQNQNNYVTRNDITITDSSNNNVAFEYYDNYKAQEGCVDTPFITRVVVHNTVENPITSNLKLTVTPHYYSPHAFTLICDGGVESPISPGEILPRATRFGCTFQITPILKKYNNVDIFKIDTKKTKAYVKMPSLGNPPVTMTYLNDGKTIRVTHSHIPGQEEQYEHYWPIALEIYTTIDADAYNEAKQGWFDPDWEDLPSGNPWE